MDKLIASLRGKDKEDPEPSSTTATGPAGKVQGQGSHFPNLNREGDGGLTGDTARSVDQPSASDNPDVRHEAIAFHDSSNKGLGTAAVGGTSTYSSHVLPKGDTVPSVVDPASSDPTTYKMPEHTYQPSTGVPSGAAETAASVAFNKDLEQSVSHIPGAYPREEPPTSTTESTQVASAAALGLAGHGAEVGSRGTSGLASERDVDLGAPSTTTTAAIPAERDAENGRADQTQNAVTTPPSTTSADDVTSQQQWSGTLGRILDAVGLGTAAGVADTSESTARPDEQPELGARSPEKPTTTTGVDSYTAPTQSGPSPSHHRKESIPTTAYPQGQSSPAPINAPVGGTAVADQERDQESHTGRNAGLAAVGVGSGVAAVGAHEYNKSRTLPEDAPSHPGASTTTYQQANTATPHVPGGRQPSSPRYENDEEPRVPSSLSQPSTVYAQPPREAERDQQFKEHAQPALAAVVGAGAGAGAVGAYEYHERKAPSQDAPIDSTSPTSTHQQITTSLGDPISPSQQNAPLGRASDQYPTTTTSFTQPSRQPSSIYSQPPVAVEQDRESTEYGKDAAAVGIGAGAGAAGIYALEHKHEPEPGDLSGEISYPAAQTSTKPQPWEVSEGTAASVSREPVTSTGRTDTIQSEAAAVPALEKATKTNPTTEPEMEKGHTGRDATVAGAAGAGAGAYGIHEHNKHEDEEEAARTEAQRQKDIAEQEAARQKQFEKDEKAATKRAVKEEKAEKKHQKGLEKEEKKHQKELEKEEKEHNKELEYEQKEREKTAGTAALAETEHQQQREREENESFEATEAERKRREEEAAAAAVGTGTVAGTAAYAPHGREGPNEAGSKTSQDTNRNRLHKDPPQKKPGILKRIFKRRKNTDTGLDEDYSTDEEEESHHDNHLREAGAVGGAGAVAGTVAAREGHESTGASYASGQGGQGGGFVKPSYNPLHKNDITPSTTGTTTTDSHSQ